MSSIDVDFNSHKPKALNHLKCNFTKYSIIFKSHVPHPSVGEESELPPVVSPASPTQRRNRRTIVFSLVLLPDVLFGSLHSKLSDLKHWTDGQSPCNTSSGCRFAKPEVARFLQRLAKSWALCPACRCEALWPRFS